MTWTKSPGSSSGITIDAYSSKMESGLMKLKLHTTNLPGVVRHSEAAADDTERGKRTPEED